MWNEKFKLWIRASRLFSITASGIPVILGGVLAVQAPEFNMGYFILSIIGIIFLHVAVNLLSDYDDFINKVDTKDSYGSSGIMIEGLLTPKEVRKGGIILFFLAGLIALFFSYKRGIVILILVIIGAISGYFYTGKPLKLKYRGLGAPVVFLTFGPLMVLGAYYLQMQEFSLKAFLVSIPLGLLTTAILHVNDIRDIQYDKRAGIKTLSMFVGIKNANLIYFSLIILSYISVIIMVFFKVIPYWSLICLITLPIGIKNIDRLRKSKGSSDAIAYLDQETAKLQAKFGILFILSILVSFVI
ncbi:1,4-dihydroxy-2-naphthoate octaprenyltransferase [Clostridium chromiireducens]|jgi:1,4-dihydroxy-2-naphthoate octaprenyltransferase|uniref:1,4-dihydroxy-2-naphthoate octaprenyltransferase n=1 Tax=Clostridium chromiireducens TaxID=225345 RepID=A0A964RL75_9CLOT|nr:1,4-dihydroxy-2-naphthoate octaprenyltransferase [Clostridium chromiireducens]MVX63702.1 1,4-dihydroxy-2-naphthoate octaprenyltransferase [Clostridium chromiireducens]